MQKKYNDEILKEQNNALLETKLWKFLTPEGQKCKRKVFGTPGFDTTNSSEAELYPVLDLDIDINNVSDEQKEMVSKHLSDSHLNKGENKKKIERSDFKDLSDMQLGAVLYSLAIKGSITANYLRKNCAESMKYPVGLAVCKIVLENLSVVYETDNESDIMKNFGISDQDWLADCIFENYMECFMKRHEYFDGEDRFMFSYEANGKLGKWLEKVIVSTVKCSYISPLSLKKYFDTLEDDMVFLEPEGFVSWHYKDAKYAIEQDMLSQDKYRYFCFYWCCIEDKNYISRFGKDSIGSLFFTLLANGLITDDLVAEGPEHYLYDLLVSSNPKEENIRNAISESFNECGNWIEKRHHVETFFPSLMNFLNESFSRPILLSIMDVMSLKEIETFLCSIFYGYDLCFFASESEREEPFSGIIFSELSCFDRTRERTNEEKSKIIELVFDCIDKLDDDRKLISIVALASPRLMQFISDDNNILQKRFCSCLDSIFDKCISDKDKSDNDFCDLLNRLVMRGKTLGLRDEQIKCVKEKISLINKQQKPKSKSKEGKKPKLGDNISPEDCMIF